MSRSRAYTREVRNKHIARKKNIVKCVDAPGTEWYKYDGQYSKGKIHCSCRMCTYSKYYDCPRFKDDIDKFRVRDAMNDYLEAM